MFKLQTKVSVVKMSHYSANQNSTQTIMKSIVFQQNKMNFLQQKIRKSWSTEIFTVKRLQPGE
jgi:hypothetical protein